MRPAQVTAPVRETAAQTLGVTLGPLSLPSVNTILHLLTKLQAQNEWDVRCVCDMFVCMCGMSSIFCFSVCVCVYGWVWVWVRVWVWVCACVCV